ncbi:MAG: DUF3616 domain-containing protein [Paracoccaceae bacterium]
MDLRSNIRLVFSLLAALGMIGPGAAQSWAQSATWERLILPAGNANGVFEPSAVRQRADGRLFLVQDEPSAALGTLTLADDGRPLSFSLQSPTPHRRDGLPRLGDLEGLARGKDGYFYAVTSHSRTTSGKRHKSRERIVRLRLTGDEVSTFDVYGHLITDIIRAYPVLGASVASPYAKGRRGFNIEGLCFDADRERLLIGLRGPVLNGASVVLVLENPAQVFGGEKPRFADRLIRLGMAGEGIRSLSYIPALGRYLLVGQKAARKGTSNRKFHLWVWGGPGSEPPKRVDIKGVKWRNSEGLTPVTLGGKDYVLFVSDDGDRRKGRPARYLLLAQEILAASISAP